ncbi:MAG TPA: adenylate/guanylate cyclase domain-containing protein [Verrucomicrobiae bacterium]|nr:adenylate/guanylate cyclase domain-containing protein [Verrucomicrobiae bacterium]
MLRFKRAGLIGAAVAFFCGLILHGAFGEFGLELIQRSYDYPFGPRPPIPVNEVVMVYLDEESHKELNQPFNAPWDRSVHARLLERLTADGARAVVFDIVFSDAGPNPVADEYFARAIRANGKVVLAADSVPAAYGEQSVQAKTIIQPYSQFVEAAAAVGSAEVVPDQDLIVRRHFHGSPDDQIPSLSWMAAEVLKAPVTRDPQQRFSPRWVNYYGPPRRTIPSVSLYRALDTNAISSGFFSNKVVFVGAHLLTKFSGERKDEYRTPFSYWSSGENLFMPGVEVQATIFLNLLRGDWLTEFHFLTEKLLILAVGLVFGFGLIQLRPAASTAVALAGMLGVTLADYLLFRYTRSWFPWTIMLVQIFTALVSAVVFNSIRLYVQNKLYEQSLALYLSPKLVKKFASNKELLRPGAKKETLTILFSDIASFTSISEGMDSDELARHMNSYFQTAVAQCIHHTDGTIVKYIGDAIFAFWNAPDPQSDHALRACEAALRFRDQPPQYMNGQQLVTRIGLHTGVANVGNFGSTARVDYTALGENINLASRMEGLNKYLGTDILITGQTQEGAGGKITTRFAGHFQLKGFEKAVEVYELLGFRDRAESTRPWCETFENALREFQRRNFDAAEAGFRCTLEMRPSDGPAKFYLRQIDELRVHPPAPDWAGEIELKEK